MGNKQIHREMESPFFADHISALMPEVFDTLTGETTNWLAWGGEERWAGKACGRGVSK
jgi:hypothetical protein